MFATLQVATVLVSDAVPITVPEAEVALGYINIVDVGWNVNRESIEFVRVVIERIWIVELVPQSMTSRCHTVSPVCVSVNL